MTRCVRCSGEMPVLMVFCPTCQHPNEPDFRHLIHQTLGNRFQLYRQLGEGGLSTIFAAIDLQTDKTVVVKVSDPRHLTQTNYSSAAERLEARQYWSEMTERMQREVAALTNVHHPNIVRVFAAGAISADLSYVVMELLRGKTLRDELNVRGRLPINEAVVLAADVAAALSVVHARGIVHRDLTPRNIFLCEETLDFGLPISASSPNTRSTIMGSQPDIQNPKSKIVKLIDFGIAKFPKQPGAQTYTQHAVMAGTPGYASPEQFQNLTVDHRADIYSLGVVLYEMVTGEKPFVGRSATEIAVKQLRDDPVRPRALVPELPQRLEALILRALAKDPAVRQQSADELAAELKTISSRVEVPLAAPALPPVNVAAMPDPSGSQVFRLLSDLVAKDEAPPEKSPTVEPITVSETIAPAPLPEITFTLPQPRRHRVLLVAACLAFLFVIATWAMWLGGGRKAFPIQIAAPTPSANTTAQPIPTLRPDVTAPRTPARVVLTRPSDNETSPEKAVVTTVSAPSKSSIAIVPVSKTPAGLPRPVFSPTPVVVAARIPAPSVTPPPVKVEPTPSPAPPPVRAEPIDEPVRSDNDGWRREPVRPTPSRPNDSVQPRPTATPAPVEPRLISWRGPVYGTREITLEMPGVPGMVDIPRDYRKKVGVIEPPSPSNGWRRTVLRVFGNGDVSLIIRWLPHREIHRQEWVRGE
ncbi:MAG TPA: protein kinase [Blastocatellia bacterium]|nr:protein kinase [Blastocatellia bacterium]